MLKKRSCSLRYLINLTPSYLSFNTLVILWEKSAESVFFLAIQRSILDILQQYYWCPVCSLPPAVKLIVQLESVAYFIFMRILLSAFVPTKSRSRIRRSNKLPRPIIKQVSAVSKIARHSWSDSRCFLHGFIRDSFSRVSPLLCIFSYESFYPWSFSIKKHIPGDVGILVFKQMLKRDDNSMGDLSPFLLAVFYPNKAVASKKIYKRLGLNVWGPNIRATLHICNLPCHKIP